MFSCPFFLSLSLFSSHPPLHYYSQVIPVAIADVEQKSVGGELGARCDLKPFLKKIHMDTHLWTFFCENPSTSLILGLTVCLFQRFPPLTSTFQQVSSVLICNNPLLSRVISPVVIISSWNHTDASLKVWKSCFIDSKGMVIDPSEFAWEYILFELRDHNRSGGIAPVSAPLAFQRLR